MQLKNLCMFNSYGDNGKLFYISTLFSSCGYDQYVLKCFLDLPEVMFIVLIKTFFCACANESYGLIYYRSNFVNGRVNAPLILD